MTNDLPIRAVLFDLDDTLYDRSAAFSRWAEEYLHRTCGLNDASERVSALARIAALDAGGYGSKKAVLEAVCRLYPPADTAKESEHPAPAFYEQFFSQLVLDEDAVTVLAALDAVSLPWGVVTNGQARQWHKLEQMGLVERTGCLFVSEAFGCAKPEPAIFLAAARCLGAAASEILFVGDYPVNDIQGARNVGMKTAWLHRGKPWPMLLKFPPDVTLGRLTELMPFLACPDLAARTILGKP